MQGREPPAHPEGADDPDDGAARLMHVEVIFFDSAEHLARRLTSEQQAALPHVTLPEGCATVDGLLCELQIIGQTRGTRPMVMVNGIYQRGDVPLHEGDRIELLQPMAGG